MRLPLFILGRNRDFNSYLYSGKKIYKVIKISYGKPDRNILSSTKNKILKLMLLK